MHAVLHDTVVDGQMVHEGTEQLFSEAFFSKLDFVTNALDNIKARNYMDGRCVWFEKPLFESGTLGTKGNVQVILPHKTISYVDGPKDEEKGIPMCTLRNFPSQIEHCIEWSRAEFHSVFAQPFSQANKVVKDPIEFVEGIRAELAHQKTRGDKVRLLWNFVAWCAQ